MIPIDQATAVIATAINAPLAGLLGPRRHNTIQLPRLVTWAVLREAGYSRRAIGTLFGRSYHAVFYAEASWRALLQTDKAFRMDFNRAVEALRLPAMGTIKE